MAPDDDIGEIILTGPREIEKFCPREPFGTVDLATSLPIAFSLLISGVEPGARWGDLEGRAQDLRYVNLCRYESSDMRTVTLRTRNGSFLSKVVPESDFLDRSIGCLDEAGVLAKQQLLCRSDLLAATSNLRGASTLAAKSSFVDDVPELLYSAVQSLMLDQLDKDSVRES